MSNWLNIGTSFKTDGIPEKIEPKVEKKQKQSKHKQKEEKEDKIVIKLSQKEIMEHYDQLLEQKYHLDTSKGFIYRHELGDGLLSVQLLPMGDNSIYLYGHTLTDIPHYHCLQKQQEQQEQQEQQSIQYQRYFQAQEPQHCYQIDVISKINQEVDFIPFNNELQQGQQIQNRVIQKNQSLQAILQSDVHNLEIWKELLNIQEELAKQQGYYQPILLANRRLSIVARLEQASEVLADHPWVLGYKIALLSQLDLNDMQTQITSLYEELFQKYIYIQPVWVLHFDFKIKQTKFCATLLRVEAENHIKQLQQLINTNARAQLIQLYKKIYIELLQQIVFYEYEMGYRERGIGILQALCELNIFAPKELQRSSDYAHKLELFKAYYDGGIRTGECDDYGWASIFKSDSSIHQQSLLRESFIIPNENDDLIKQILQFQSIPRWKPAHQDFDQDWINFNSDSLVIYEDIQPYLYIFNDSESKLELLNILLDSLGFPSIETNLLPQMNTVYSTRLPNINIQQNDLLIKYDLYHIGVNQLIYVSRILEKAFEILQDQSILLYQVILNGVLYVKGCKESKLKQILKTNQKNILFWQLFVEFEEMKTNKIQQVIQQQIYSSCKSLKQKMMVLYFQFNKATDYNAKISIIKSVVLLYDQNDNMSESTLVLKMRGLFSQAKVGAKNKQFPLSKRSMLLIFVMYLEQYSIELHLNNFSGNEFEFLILNTLRFAEDKLSITTLALKRLPHSLIVFTTHIEQLSKKFLYFQKLQLFTQINQKCWIAKLISQDPSKQWFIYEYLKSDRGKPLITIYCESPDQENFQGIVNLKYIYQLDKLVLQLENILQPSVKSIYRTINTYPYSMGMYTTLIQELQEQKESINIITEIQEKELKYI